MWSKKYIAKKKRQKNINKSSIKKIGIEIVCWILHKHVPHEDLEMVISIIVWVQENSLRQKSAIKKLSTRPAELILPMKNK